MLLLNLIILPIIGIFLISIYTSYYPNFTISKANIDSKGNIIVPSNNTSMLYNNTIKYIGLSILLLNMVISFVIFIGFDFSNNHFQFVQEYYEISSYDLYLGLDGLSIYFVLLTTIIMPIALLSN